MDEQKINEIKNKMKPEGTPGESEQTAPLSAPIEAIETAPKKNLTGEAPASVASPIGIEMETAAPTAPAAVSPLTTGYSVPMTPPVEALPLVEGLDAEREMRRISRRSFLWAGGAIVGVLSGRHWLNSRSQDNGIPWPLRRSLEINEQINRDYFQTARLSPTFPRARAVEPRPNGEYGLDSDVDPDWTLSLAGLPDTDQPTMISLDDIKKMPKTEIVTELKCIEGWSVVVQWAGVRFADFLAHYWPKEHPLSELPAYVAMETPDGAYYVGLDKASAMHPQTLLCYEMNGAALTDEHGAPLRLAIPVKYGIKNIKRIGTIRLTDARPKDYWAEQGYDWYAGH